MYTTLPVMALKLFYNSNFVSTEEILSISKKELGADSVNATVHLGRDFLLLVALFLERHYIWCAALLLLMFLPGFMMFSKKFSLQSSWMRNLSYAGYILHPLMKIGYPIMVIFKLGNVNTLEVNKKIEFVDRLIPIELRLLFTPVVCRYI